MTDRDPDGNPNSPAASAAAIHIANIEANLDTQSKWTRKLLAPIVAAFGGWELEGDMSLTGCEDAEDDDAVQIIAANVKHLVDEHRHVRKLFGDDCSKALVLSKLVADGLSAQADRLAALEAELARLREERGRAFEHLRTATGISQSVCLDTIAEMAAKKIERQQTLIAGAAQWIKPQLEIVDSQFAKIQELVAQLTAASAQRIAIARAYDPNCDEYVYEDEFGKMKAARQVIEAVQELAASQGRDPEGCLIDAIEDAVGLESQLTAVREFCQRRMGSEDMAELEKMLEGK